MVEVLKKRGILPGIKNDKGLITGDHAGVGKEKGTEGLDDMRKQ